MCPSSSFLFLFFFLLRFFARLDRSTLVTRQQKLKFYSRQLHHLCGSVPSSVDAVTEVLRTGVSVRFGENFL
eukprot:m.2778 g.2778  ORF g.2778 m.2778 type:complete len:72 (-) comp1656_c0_seq1:195-410(-)